MVDTVHDRHIVKCKGVDTVDTGDIESELGRIGALLMMRVYPAGSAKVVACRVGVPLIQRQLIRAVGDGEVSERHAGHYRALAPAQRAVAAPHVLQAVTQSHRELDRAAMTLPLQGFSHDLSPMLPLPLIVRLFSAP